MICDMCRAEMLIDSHRIQLLIFNVHQDSEEYDFCCTMCLKDWCEQ